MQYGIARLTLVEHGLGLTTKSCLLSIVTPLPLRVQRILSLLVLSDLVKPVLLAFLRDAKRLARFRDDNLAITQETGWNDSVECKRFAVTNASRWRTEKH